MTDLIQRSLAIIQEHQQPGGAYPAAPHMPDYQYCWFRDGSFVAHAMGLYGQWDSARAFHEWAAQTILRYEDGARRAMADFQSGQIPAKQNVLWARYAYDGRKGPDDWPEFQLDGLGTWLWALKQFRDNGQSYSPGVHRAAELVGDYLAILWPSPCHDLWEEHGDRIHTYTLGAIYAGLNAAAVLLDQSRYTQAADQLRAFLWDHCVHTEHGFSKSVGSELVDGSLAALAVPYHVVRVDDPVMETTVRRIETELYAPGAGVHRYRGDTYYGGGAWLLLAAWLGWYYAETGNLAQARAILTDIGRHATPDGDLPEQIAPPMLAAVSDYEHWVRVRGPIATPLLWSHAMYLILAHACRAD